MAKIKSIIKKQINDQLLMNLAVESDESFIANGIVVHNCKSFLSANLTTKEITGLPPISKAAKKSITLNEYIDRIQILCDMDGINEFIKASD